MFEIKICGITNLQDAQASRDNGADAIGLNFYERSLRSVTVEQACQITDVLQDSICKVGVFVRRPPSEINAIVEECQLDMIQLHGEQQTECVKSLDLLNVVLVRAIPWTDAESVKKSVDEWRHAGASAVLLDSRRGKQFGGTGKTIDWTEVSAAEFSLPVVLAGGLTPDNVFSAISTSGIARVDTASGIESMPGKKDHELLARFIQQARAAIDGKGL